MHACGCVCIHLRHTFTTQYLPLLLLFSIAFFKCWSQLTKLALLNPPVCVIHSLRVTALQLLAKRLIHKRHFIIFDEWFSDWLVMRTSKSHSGRAWIFGSGSLDLFNLLDLVASYMIYLHKWWGLSKGPREEGESIQRYHWWCVYPSPWAPKQIL